MLRSLVNPNGPRVCLVHQRSYAIMNRAKTRAGIAVDAPPIKAQNKPSPTQQGDGTKKMIRYEKPKDRSYELRDRRALDRFPKHGPSSKQYNKAQQPALNQPKYREQQQPLQEVKRYGRKAMARQSQIKNEHPTYKDIFLEDRPGTEQPGYRHPLKQTMREREDRYDPWAPTPLKVIKRSTTAETESPRNAIEWDSSSSINAFNDTATSPPEDVEIEKPLPLSLSLRERIMRLNEQKSAGMTERLVKPIKEFTQPENPHFIKVAVIGAPNAGKSTLVNKIVGEEVSIVSSKSHTTRERILAILSEKNYQVVFLDTPGIISPKSKENMNRSITTSSWRSLDEADHVLIMMDSKYASTKESQQVQEFMMERLSVLDIPATLLFNKMDVIGQDAMESLEKIADQFKSVYPNIRNQLYISALEEDGVNDVKNILFESAKAKPWVYPPEQRVEISDLKRVEELIRVEFFKRLHRYIPYMLKQENMVWAELANGALRIEQNVYVERDSQHKIVVGANGMIINRVVEDARLQISKAFKRPIHLFIQVKTRKK